MAKRFTDEEMKPDPEPEAPSISTNEDFEAKPKLPTSADRASHWFDRNKLTRVPLIALEKDPYQMDDQKWVVFSMIKPEEYGKLTHGEKEYHGYLIKFRGCFPTKELATAHIHKLLKVDKHFDIHLIPAFQWSAIDDTSVEDREYADERISDIMKGYFRQENDRMIGLRDRIKKVEENTTERSEEASQFFNDMQEEIERPKIEDVAPETESVTLDELAKRLELKKIGGSVLASHEGGLSAEKQDAIVSEIILENEGSDSDSCDELMK